jgi:hypothetical protein
MEREENTQTRTNQVSSAVDRNGWFRVGAAAASPDPAIPSKRLLSKQRGKNRKVKKDRAETNMRRNQHRNSRQKTDKRERSG